MASTPQLPPDLIDDEQLLAFVDAIPTLAWMAAGDGSIFWYNRRWYEYTGTTPEQMKGWGWQSVHDPEVLPEVMDRWTAAIRTGQPFEMVFPLRRADGSFCSFLTRVVPVRDAKGAVYRWFGTNTDVDDLQKARETLHAKERELHRQRELLEVAQSAARAGFWRFEINTGAMEWSSGSYAIFGLPQGSKISSESFWRHIHPEDRRVVADAMQKAQQTGEYYAQYRIVKDGGERWVAGRAKLFEDPVTGPNLMGINLDITAEKLREQELREQADLIDVAQSAANAGIFRWHIPSDSKYVSPHSYRLFELEPRETISAKELHGNVVPEDLVRVQEAVRRSLETGHYDAEFRVRKPDGTVRWISAKGRLFHSASNEPYLLGLNVDVTDKKLAEETLLKTEKIAAVGRLASSISHEINNPLEAVTNLLYLAATNNDVKEIHKFLDTAQHELQRVTDIVTQTLRFHRQATKPRMTKLSELVGSVLKLHQPKLTRSNIVVRAVYRSDEPVLCFDGEMRQVFANLIGNAIDAIGDGGRLYIRISRALPALGIDGMRVTIADTGQGIPPNARAHLFEPFYTTKGATGSGLGLWVSAEIVNKHHGRIRLHSSQRPGMSGTVFQVSLPFRAPL